MDLENFPNDELAQQMIAMVSPIYDNSYVGKWLYQIMGIALEIAADKIYGLADEGFPERASLMLSTWEKAYGIETNENLSDEKRQAALKAKKNIRNPMNPYRIASIISSITGRACYVRENTAPSTYEVCIEQGESEAVLDKVREMIEKIQQAKIVVIVFVASCGIKIRAEPTKKKYAYQMTGTELRSGTYPWPVSLGRVEELAVTAAAEVIRQVYPYVMAGVNPEPANIGMVEKPGVSASVSVARYSSAYKMCGTLRPL